MRTNEYEKLTEYIKRRFDEEHLDHKTFDAFAYIDTSLTLEEAKAEIDEKINNFLPSKEDIQEYKNREKRYDQESKDYKRGEREKLMEDEGREMFKEQANVLILGKKRSGKTSLGMTLMKEFGEYGRMMYIYRHPRPESLKSLPFEVVNLVNLKQISNLTNAVVLIDEAHKVFPVMEKTVNSQLRDILSLSGQNNICFIFVTHNSYFLNRSLFNFIDIRIIKEMNEGHLELERPYMKKLYENVNVLGNNNFFIDSDYHRGIESFEKPEWFTEELSFAYKNEEKKDFFKKMRENASSV